ncbi:MAG: helix-turn-helix domain-containing protein, partial [Haloarculaceae archaeon]
MSTIERLGPDGFAEPDPDIQYLSVDDAGRTAAALGSRTAQSILAELGGDPATTSEVADRAGTSVQNAGYHLSKLRSAGLVTVVGTRYSEKGAEMDVYARTVGAIVIGAPSSAEDRE